MKLKSFVLVSFWMITFTACDVIKQVASVLAPSQFEMAMGLKQALEQGLFTSFDAYGNPKSNPALTFVFPSDAQKIINLANQAGLGKVINQTTEKFNTAISQSFTAAKPIFLQSLKSMNIGDAAGILITNNQTAATDYFKTNTQQPLMKAFRPIIDSTIQLQGADKEWRKIATVINNIPFSNFKVEPSLTDFVAARAIDGMYMLVAEEEKKIRTNLAFRKTDLVKKVFGYADEQLKTKQ